MEIVTGEQMRRIDARTIEGRGVPGTALMENAGRGVAEALVREIPGLARRPVVVVCGKGNNGGDGLVAARHLLRLGVAARVVFLSSAGALRGDPAANLARAREAGVPIEEAIDEKAWRAAAPIPRRAVVVDAILGTGVRGAARGLTARVIEDVNASGATVVAIDVPSGIDADDGGVPGPAIFAHRTLTLCRPKLGLVLEPAASHAGPFAVIDIGIPDDDVAAEASLLAWTDADAAAALLPPRPASAHKGTMGHLLAVAGSRGKSGAAALLARAALRSGVGLVTVATARSAQPIVAAAEAEVMTEPLLETRSGAIATGALPVLRRLLAARSALAIGPGLGTEATTRALVRALAKGPGVPCVLDADGLNAFAHDGRARPALRAGAFPLVLTPHPGEAARLLGTTARDVQADRLGSASTLASATGAVVVLKGPRTIVVAPSGRAAFNATGNPGMATGGTGDVLTGVVGALLARGMEGFDAARLGTYLHGGAGDRAADRLGEDGMIAGDLVEELPGAWRTLHARRTGGNGWTHGA
jgi:ADP-dependent NAD(P)H-hydrate dehydratase / NAD(P)H-hydrate epimerase